MANFEPIILHSKLSLIFVWCYLVSSYTKLHFPFCYPLSFIKSIILWRWSSSILFWKSSVMSKLSHLTIRLPFTKSFTSMWKIQLGPFKQIFFEQNNSQYSGKSIKLEQEEKEHFEYSSRVQQFTIWVNSFLQLEVDILYLNIADFFFFH